MILKEVFQYGYETLVEDVSTNLSLKKFCRIPMEEDVPDSTTLIKVTHKYGEDTIKKLNNPLTEVGWAILAHNLIKAVEMA